MARVCEICGHEKMVHAVWVNGKPKLMCEDCRRDFERQREARKCSECGVGGAHFIVRWGGIERVVCNECSRKFSRRRNDNADY